MQADLREFLIRYAATVAMALVPVVFTAFVSMPLSLARHPGELPAEVATAPREASPGPLATALSRRVPAHARGSADAARPRGWQTTRSSATA